VTSERIVRLLRWQFPFGGRQMAVRVGIKFVHGGNKLCGESEKTPDFTGRKLL
jgi:hypothetical protein